MSCRAVDHSWCAELPPKVKEGSAAWLSRSSGTILLRPTHFANKSIRYVLVAPSRNRDMWKGDGAHESAVECYAVPEFKQVRAPFLLLS